MDDPSTATRRQVISGLLAFGGIAAAGATVAAAGGADAAQAAAATAPPSDADLVAGMLATEELAIAVYEAVLASNLLSPQPEHTARRALSQERAHVRALMPALEKLGGTMPPSLGGTAAIDKALADRHISGRLAKLRTEHDCVSLLLDLESELQATYFKAMSQLRNRGVMRLAAQIMANEAQHATAISEARRPGDIGQAVPYAFVEGRH
jgi:Ferritin-like domain